MIYLFVGFVVSCLLKIMLAIIRDVNMLEAEDVVKTVMEVLLSFLIQK
jgi:hypothetical protein